MNLFQFPASSSEFSLDTLEIERHKDYGSALYEVLQGESDSQVSRYGNLGSKFNLMWIISIAGLCAKLTEKKPVLLLLGVFFVGK